MVWTSFSDANILNIFSAGSLLPGYTVHTILIIRNIQSAARYKNTIPHNAGFSSKYDV